MTDLSNQRRLAATILKCGEGRVWIDPASQEELADAVTRADIRSAIKARVIRRMPVKGTSRARARRHAEEIARKERWMRRIRAQRKLLLELRTSQRITPKAYREFYRKAKGGMFRSRAHLLINLRLAGVLPERGP